MKTLLTTFASALVAGSLTSAEVKVDFARETGRIKPMHAVGQGPLLGWNDFSMFRYLKEAGVPYARLHDVGGPYGKNLYVDIPNVFRDFDADETRPESYDFTYTDLYLKALVENGVEPYFRLGVTIENSVRETKKACRLYPPKDFAKWARVCEHVVRHYTEGWADGFRMKIAYWEIWNEADDFPDYRNAMWWGTWRQFCELFDVTAKHLKACFPHLKVGGYGKCSAHNVTFELKGQPVPEDEAYRHRCFVEFCDYIKAHRTPLDFFSFHGYIGPELVKPHTDYHRRWLAKAGYGDVELHLNEWLCGDRSGEFWKRTALATLIAEFVLAAQQSENLDMAHIYDAKCGLGKYAPLFDPIAQRPAKAFYALKDFNVLYRLGREVKCEVTGVRDRFRAVAAKGEGSAAAVMVVNNSGRAERLVCDFGGREPAYCLVTDDYRMDTFTELPAELPGHSFLLVVFR